MPEGGRVAPGVVISIEGVNAIVLGDQEHNIVGAFVRDGNVRKKKRLCVNRAIDRLAAEVKDGDVVLTLGAGSVWTAGDGLLRRRGA